jgi:AraC-like DNA-binding protein
MHSFLSGRESRLERSTAFQTCDIDETRAYIGALFKEHDLEVIGAKQKPDVVVRHASLEHVDLVYDRHGANVEIFPDKLDDFFLLQIPLAGHAIVNVENRAETYGPGTACLISSSVGVRMSFSGDCEHLNVRVSHHVLMKALERALGDCAAHSLIFRPFIDFTKPEHAALMNLITYLVNVTYYTPKLLRIESNIKHLADLLVDTMLMTVDSNYRGILTGREGRFAPAHVRRARSFIRENLKNCVSSTDIARAAHVSTRSMFAGFAAYYGMGPMTYLRNLRLDAVHETLERSASQDVQVSDVAAEYGFLHFGHFAAAYHERFGELPRATLSRTSSELRS